MTNRINNLELGFWNASLTANSFLRLFLLESIWRKVDVLLLMLERKFRVSNSLIISFLLVIYIEILCFCNFGPLKLLLEKEASEKDLIGLWFLR